MKSNRWCGHALVVAAICLAPGAAGAQAIRVQGPLDSGPTVCSLGMLLREGRVELGAVHVASLGPGPSERAVGAGATYWVGDSWGLAVERQATARATNATRGHTNAAPGQLRAPSVQRHDGGGATLAGLRLIPVRGKMAALGGVLPIDLDVTLGAARAAGETRAVAAARLNVFVTDWLAASLGAQRIGATWSATFGLSALLPLEPRPRCVCR